MGEKEREADINYMARLPSAIAVKGFMDSGRSVSGLYPMYEAANSWGV